MKKILTALLIFIWTIHFVFAASNSCGKVWSDINWKSLSSLLSECQPDGTIEWKTKKSSSILWGLISISTTSNEWYDIDNAKGKILAITKKLVLLASILAIGWIVYAWIEFTTAYWKDEKHKKWKDIIKWSILWFVATLVAQQLINAVINLIYWVSSR